MIRHSTALSGLDKGFLLFESPETPMHVAALLSFSVEKLQTREGGLDFPNPLPVSPLLDNVAYRTQKGALNFLSAAYRFVRYVIRTISKMWNGDHETHPVTGHPIEKQLGTRPSAHVLESLDMGCQSELKACEGFY